MGQHLPRTLLVALSVLALASGSTARAEDKLDGKEVLRRAEAAVRKINAVRYEASYTAEGWVAQYVSPVKGIALLGAPSKYGIEKFRSAVTLNPGDAEKESSHTLGCNGDVFYVVDTKTKTVHEDMDPVVLGSNGRHLQRLLLRDYVSDKPFEEELKAEELALDGTEKVNDVACHKVKIKYSSSQEATWYFSAEGYLPMRVDRAYTNPDQGVATTSLVLSNVQPNPPLDESAFDTAVPDGFTKTDEFAP